MNFNNIYKEMVCIILMRLKVLILLGIFLVSSFSVSGQSSTVTDFNIGGCIFDFEGENVGVAPGECSIGDSFGEFYCGEDKDEWITREVGLGCSRGRDDYTEGEPYCCPRDMACEDVGGGEFRCIARTEPCVDYVNSGECAEGGCTWLELLESGKCVDDLTNYGCDYYNTELLCGTDEFNFGQIGIGTELSGTYIECAGRVWSIPVERYECKWYNGSIPGKECRITYSAVEAGYDNSTIQSIFSCSNIYELGECIDGKQDVRWFSDSTAIAGFTSDIIPEECLEVFECNGGEDERFCGEPTIKLSGFSLFAFFISLLVIGMHYFFRNN